MRKSSALSITSERPARLRAGFVFAAFLAVLTVLVMVGLASSLEPYAAASNDVSDTRTAAQNYYDGVNQVLMTGASSSLPEYVAADARFSDGIEDGWLNFDELVGRLAEIGEGNPHARLDVTSLTTDGTDAVAVLRLSGAGDYLTTAIGVDGDGGWIDRLTIRDGVVTALSGGTAGLRSSTIMLDGTVQHTRSLANVGLVTLTIDRGAAVPVTVPGALVVVVENGTLHLDFDAGTVPAAILRRDTLDAGAKLGHSIELRAGDHFSVLEGAGFTLSAGSQQSASVQLIALLNPLPGDPAAAPKQQHGRFSGFLVNGAAGSTWTGSPGGEASMLSRHELATQAGLKRLRIERIDLMPGSRLVPDLTATGDRQFVVFSMEGAVVVAPAPGTPGMSAEPALLDRDQAISLTGGMVQISQVGEIPASLIVIWLEHLGPV